MSLSILNVGSRKNEALLYQATATRSNKPLVTTFNDPAQAHLWASLHQPDITVVDMRHLNGHGTDFVRRFRADPECGDIPLLAVVNELDRERRAQALLAGAHELITAPLDPYECQARILNLLTLKAQRRMLARQHEQPDADGADTSQYLRSREREVLLRLARTGEFRDESTGTHIVRMGAISRRIAERLSLSPAECEIIETSAPMHDIGKIGIPDSILRKAGPLTSQEREVMNTHCQIGYDMLKNSQSPYLQCGAEIALTHHEKFDGTGYPYGLRREEIPLCARIVAVADVYDALSNHRPYKLAWPPAKVTEYLTAQAGKHFDPHCVKALFDHLDSVAAL